MTGNSKKVLYLGDDGAYFKVLEAEFLRLYSDIKLIQFSAATPQSIQHLMMDISLQAPEVVFIDFSKHTDDFVHLSRILANLNKEKPLPIIGLHDYLAKPENIKLSFLAGVMINHLKGAEVFDVVFSAINLATPGQAKEHGFATGKIQEKVQAFHLVKIGFLAENFLHLETNLDFEKNQELRMHHSWVDKKLIPSTLTRVKETSKEMLYYNFKNSVDLEFAWVEPVVVSDTDDEQRTEELKNERAHYVQKAKKAIKTWLDENVDRSGHKSVRVLIVDRSFRFFNNRARSDSYGYALRCQPFIIDMTTELLAQRPQVIAVSLDAEAKGYQYPNDMAFLEKLVAFVKEKMAGEAPYLVVFNLKDIKSKELQANVKYSNIMAMDADIDPDILLKMAKIFSEKLINLPVAESIETKFFVKKCSDQSIGEIEDELEIVQISECDLIVQSQRPLAHGMSLRITTPFEGMITIVDHPQNTKPPLYYALINGVGEIEKKNLRRYVNSIFFKDHDAAKAAEVDAFKALNEAKLKEQQDKEKAEQEALAKAKAIEAAPEPQQEPTPES
jgi:hypothetical protein